MLQIKRDSKSAIEVQKALNQLQTEVQDRLEQAFLPSSVHFRGSTLEEHPITSLEEQRKVSRRSTAKVVRKFYRSCMSYLEGWCNQCGEISSLPWASLTSALLWNDVQRSEQFITSELSRVHLNEKLCFAKPVTFQVMSRPKTRGLEEPQEAAQGTVDGCTSVLRDEFCTLRQYKGNY